MTDEPTPPLTDEELAEIEWDYQFCRDEQNFCEHGWVRHPVDRLVAEVRRLRADEREARLLLIARLPPADDPAVPHTAERTWDDVHIADLVRELVKLVEWPRDRQ
jgi:hypothetical protein